MYESKNLYVSKKRCVPKPKQNIKNTELESIIDLNASYKRNKKHIDIDYDKVNRNIWGADIS